MLNIKMIGFHSQQVAESVIHAFSTLCSHLKPLEVEVEEITELSIKLLDISEIGDMRLAAVGRVSSRTQRFEVRFNFIKVMDQDHSVVFTVDDQVYYGWRAEGEPTALDDDPSPTLH